MKTNGKIQLYPMLRVAIFLIAGILVGEALYGVVPLWAWFAAAAACLLCVILAIRWCVLQSVLALVSMFLIGGFITTNELDKIHEPLPQGEIAYDAVVVSRPVEVGKVVRLDLITTNTPKPMKIKAAIYRDERAVRLREGDGIAVRSQMERPTNYAKSTFDYSRYLLYHGYTATTFIYITDWKNENVSIDRLSVVERAKINALRFRAKLLDKYGQMGFTGQDYAVMAAMTLGDKSALDKGLKDDYSVSGASHVLALSGLHLGIIYAILSLFFGRRRWRMTGQVLIILAIWTYVFIVGMSVSVMRSAVMLTVYSFISLPNRDRMSLNALSLAAVVILLFSPLYFYDVGFQMSFMSVLFIILFYMPILRLMPENIRGLPVVCWLWQMTAISIAAQIGVAPLVAFYFGRFSCYFLLTNFIVIPSATVILYGAVLSVPLCLAPVLQHWLASGLLVVVSLLNRGVSFVASLPGASIEGIRINVLQLVLVYTIIATLAVIFAMLKKMLRQMP